MGEALLKPTLDVWTGFLGSPVDGLCPLRCIPPSPPWGSTEQRMLGGDKGSRPTSPHTLLGKERPLWEENAHPLIHLALSPEGHWGLLPLPQAEGFAGSRWPPEPPHQMRTGWGSSVRLPPGPRQKCPSASDAGLDGSHPPGPQQLLPTS